MAKNGIIIDPMRLEEALKFNGLSQRAFSKLFAEKTGIKVESARITILRWMRTCTMDEAHLRKACELLDVSPSYIDGTESIIATTEQEKRRMDTNGLYIRSYINYFFETEIKPLTKYQYSGETYLTYLFEKYEITSSDGIRYMYKDVISEQFEKNVVDAIQGYLGQYRFKEYPCIKWEFHSDEEEEK